MPEPCKLAETVVAFDRRTGTLTIGEKRYSLLHKKCRPAGCPFAADQKYKTTETEARHGT